MKLYITLHFERINNFLLLCYEKYNGRVTLVYRVMVLEVMVDVTCMHTNFGGRDPSGFGDMATFQKQPNFAFGAWTIVHGHGKF